MKRARIYLPLLGSASVVLLAACATSRQAPVVEQRSLSAAKPGQSAPLHVPPESNSLKSVASDNRFHLVQHGETLYRIALGTGLDYRELADWNNLANPNAIKAGQQLRLSPLANGAAAGVVTTPLNTNGVAAEKAISKSAETAGRPAVASASPAGEPNWVWPADGRPKAAFNEATKGVDIPGRLGESVYASAAGKVIYTGDGVRGFGKLVVIKHNPSYSSVYAHNSQLLVKEGQTVRRGQKIAEMGSTDADRVKLHFEIRRMGKPVDPMKYLPEEKISS